MYDLVIEDGTIIAASGRQVADLCIEDGKIVYVGARPAGAAREKVSAIGRFVLPGLIDTHVHFRDPGHPDKEDWESGSRAAASGGVTTVCDMPNTQPPTLDRRAWEDKASRAAEKSRVNYGIWVGASAGNVDEARALADDGPACGIKVFMGASTGPLLVDDATLVRFFEQTRALLGVHAEDERVLQAARERLQGRTPATHHEARPVEAARTAVRRLIELVRAHPRPVHICHVSTAAELELLDQVRDDEPITAEVAPHHLWLSNEADLGNYGKVNPPLRPELDRRSLWAALRRGHLDTIGSDHAPHTRAEKEQAYADAPAGMPGVETTLPLLLAAARQGRISLERIVRMACERPATLFGFRRKGYLRAGFDADVVVIREQDAVKWTTANLLTRAGWSPLLRHRLAPKPDAVYVGGRRVAASGAIADDSVRGTLVSPQRDVPPA